jgi:FMN-dependent NADH-azoreductase
VARGAAEVLARLGGRGVLTREVRLWRKEELVRYSVEHTRAKVAVLGQPWAGERRPGPQATREEQEMFAPVLRVAEELNSVDVVLISTPMWNYSVPYSLKQYIDTAVQPGINFPLSGQPPEGGGQRALVVVSSAGGLYGEGQEGPTDFLNPFLGQVFGMMGFQRQFRVFVQGTMERDRQEALDWTLQEAAAVAEALSHL